MDPNAALELVRSGDAETAREAAENLRDWVARGGYEPADPTWREAVESAL